ncbi:MAG: hypothetical protein KKB50_14605 [Planctomycetes bacterium]|nr:hypothetical protein [Planctomycetota bacterium]
MAKHRDSDRAVSRREFIQAGAAGLAGGILLGSCDPLRAAQRAQREPTLSHIFHSANGTPAQNVAKVFRMAYGGIENFIGYDDIVLLRPNLQWPRNGYTNSEIGIAMIGLILKRPGGFGGEIIVIEDEHRSDPHASSNSGWCTTDKASNGPYNWFEVIQYFIDHADQYPNGIHTDPVTGQINVSFQFLQGGYSFTLAEPHPILSTYGGASYAGANTLIDAGVDPFLRYKNDYPDKTCLYVRRSDLRYTNDIARVAPLANEYYMSYPVFKSQHSGLYVSYFKDHVHAWNSDTESFTAQPVKLINMSTLNHHGSYAGVTSIVKAHFGMVYGTFHSTGWPDGDPRTFYYAGGTIGYWLDTIRQPDLHMSCAERIGRTSRQESDAYRAKSIVISTDPVALDYYVGKYILFPAGGTYGLDGSQAGEPWSNDPSLPGGYYGLTLEFCRDPLADHSIINGTLDEQEMVVHRYDFPELQTAEPLAEVEPIDEW